MNEVERYIQEKKLTETMFGPISIEEHLESIKELVKQNKPKEMIRFHVEKLPLDKIPDFWNW